MEVKEMKVSVGQYTLFVIFTLCFIPCLFLLIGGWSALGLPQVLTVVGPALLFGMLLMALGKRWRGLRKFLDGQPPESLRVGRLTVHVLRSEPDLTRGRRAYLVGIFLLWLAAMICLMFVGVSRYGARSIAASLVVVIITLPLLVNHLEHRWRA